jgi:hypothetical protein
MRSILPARVTGPEVRDSHKNRGMTDVHFAMLRQPRTAGEVLAAEFSA